MFEDFSFSSPTSQPPRLAIDTDDRLMIDCDSALISPLSSRCSSPSQRFRTLSRSKSSYFRSPPPTSVPFSYEQKRLSISTLTQKLHEHTIQPSTSADRGRLNYDGFRLSGRYPGYVLTPPDTDHDETGRSDSTPSTCSNPSPTSIPPEFSRSLEPPMEFPHLEDHLSVRTRRQNISQLQCNKDEMEAIRRAVLSEDSLGPELSQDDCHPSSLPPRSSPRRRALALNRSRFGLPDIPTEARGPRRSSLTTQSHRIEKSHIPFPGRDASKRCEQGLRRKSMVSAALASVAEHV